MPEYRQTTLRYAGSITVLQLGWLGLLFMPTGWWVYGWFVLFPLELLSPIWAESKRSTTFHPHHIAARYGLLTIVVIGESVLAGTLALQSSLDIGAKLSDLIWVILAAPLIIFSMWWIYFSRPHHKFLNSSRSAFIRGFDLVA